MSDCGGYYALPKGSNPTSILGFPSCSDLEWILDLLAVG